MSNQSASVKNSNYLIKCIVGLAIAVLFWVLPPFGQLSAAGMKVLGLFLMVIYFCIVNEIAWPSVLAVAAFSFVLMEIYPDTAMSPLYQAVEYSWGYNIIIFVIASLFITYALSEVGFMNRLANSILRMKIARKNPWTFTYALMAIALFLGLWFDPSATLLFAFGFVKPIFAKLGFEKGEKWPAMVVTGIAFSICIAFGMTPISHPLPILALGVYQNMTGNVINFVTYMALGIPVGLVCFIGMLLILRFMVKPDMKKLENVNYDELIEKPTPMSRREQATVGIAGFVFGCWLLAGFLSAFASGAALTKFFNSITTLMPAIVGVVLLSCIHVDGKPLMPFEKGMRGGVQWSMAVLLAALFMLGNALTQGTTGFNATIAGVMGPFINSGISGYVIMVIIMTVVILLTNVLNNIPVVMLMLSVCIPLSGALGLDPLAVTLLITVSGQMAFAMPSAFPAITMTYSDEYAKPRIIFTSGIVVMLWCMLVMACIAYPMAKVMF